MKSDNISAKAGCDSNALQFLGRSPADAISLRAFIQNCAALGVRVPDNLRLDRHGAMDFTTTPEASALIEGLVERGGWTAVVEGERVEPNLLSSRLVAALGHHEDVLTRHWRNLAACPVRRVAFIDIERHRPYVQLLRQFGEAGDRSHDLLFNSRFLEKPLEEGLDDFKAILRNNSPQVVVFDTEAAPGEGAKQRLFREVLRQCLVDGIALVLVLRDEKDLATLPMPDHLVRVHKYGDGASVHLVASGEQALKIQLQDGKLESEEVDPGILDQLGAPPTTDSKPGVDLGYYEKMSAPKSEVNSATSVKRSAELVAPPRSEALPTLIPMPSSDPVDDPVGGQVDDQVHGQVDDQVHGQVDDQVRGQVDDPVGGPVGGPVDGQVGRLLDGLADGAASSSELMAALGLKHRASFRESSLNPALSMGLIERTIPDSPNSRNQKYRLTLEGERRLADRRR